MLRLPHILALVIVASMMSAQDPPLGPPTHTPLPGPITKTYDVGGVNRLEFIITLTDTGKEGPVDNAEIYCTNYCNGKKHFLHNTCDTSCDSACTGLHQIDVDPTWQHKDANGNTSDHNTMGDIATGGARFGADTPEASVSYTVHTDVRDALKDAQTGNPKYRISVRYRHFNDKPCSRTTRKMKGRVYDVSIQWKFYRDTEVDGKTLRTNGPSGTTPYAQVTIPEQKYEDVHRENCRCSIVQEDGQTGFVPGGTGTSTTAGGGTSTGQTTGTTGSTATGTTGGTTPTTGGSVGQVPDGGIRLGEDPFGPLLGDGNQVKIGFGVTCNSMFQGEAYATNPFNMPLMINMAAGTCFDTDNDGEQDEVLLASVVMNVPPAEPLSPGEGPDPVRVKLRLGCLEINKREPSPTTKYRVMPSRDPILSRLAAITDKSRMRGPWDQARIWIYTDAATHQQIKDKLIPAPAANSYIRVMHEAADAGVPIWEKRYEKCFAPNLLSALDSDPKHLAWFAGQVAQRSPAGIMAWAKTECARYGQALAPGTDPRDFEAAAALISALCASGSKQAQQAGFLLLTGVPQASRATLMSRGLAAVWALCLSKDDSLAKAARVLVEEFGPEGKAFYLANGKR